MQKISERIKKARNDVGLTQQELADKLGISIRTLQNYEKGDKEPPINIMKNIAQICNSDLLWLLTGEGEMYKSNKGGLNVAENKIKNAIEVNYLPEVYAAAGYGAVNGDYPVVEKMQCSLGFVASILNIKNPYNGVDIIKVIGDSMEPFISNGEVVVIEKTNNAQNGDIVIANINGNIYVKRLEKDPFGKWVKLISENPEYETIKIEGDELNYLQIVGVVRAKIRPF